MVGKPLRTWCVIFAVVLVAVAGSSVVLVGSASAGDVSTSPYANSSNDPALAGLVTAPSAALAFQGSANPSLSLFDPSLDGNGAAINLRGAIGAAAERSGFLDVDPFAFVAAVAVTTVGAVVVSTGQGLFWHWLDDQWGAAPATSSPCGAASTGGSECQPVFFSAGQPLCVGVASNGTGVTTPAPESGFYVETTRPWWDNPGCGTGGTILSVASNDTSALATASSIFPAPVTLPVTICKSVCGNAVVFMKPGTGTSEPDGFHLDRVDSSGTVIGRFLWPHSNGDFTGTLPSNSDAANALRYEITGPDDTCAGSACPWGSGAVSQAQANEQQNIANCVLTPTCQTDVLSPTFTMPNCAGMVPSDCETAMNDLGFTGTLDQSVATPDVADYTQAPGVVLSTSPMYGLAVSTTASTIVEATTNPGGCTWNVQNPHISAGTDNSVDVKAVATCNEDATVTGSLSLWKCDEEPQADLAGLNNGEWGCAPAAPPVVGDVRTVTVSQNPEATFQVPVPGSDEVTGDGKWFIAYGTCDVCTKSPQFSTIAQLPAQ